jgi:hypothetical protein
MELRVEVVTNHVRARTNRLTQGRAASHHRVERRGSFRPTRRVVVAERGVGDELLENEPEGRA